MVTGQDIAQLAYQQVLDGDPYVWGAEGPDAFDCSGLVKWCYQQFGISVPRVTFDQFSQLQPITREELRPGDLIFSSWGGDRPASHVGIYAGNGVIIEAPEPGRTVTATQLTDTYWSNVDGYRRVAGVNGGKPGDDQGWLEAIGEAARRGGQAIGSALTSPFNVAENLTEAVGQTAEAMRGVAVGAMQMGAVASMVTKIFLPNNLIRTVCFAMGTAFMLIGIWFLAREVKASTP